VNAFGFGGKIGAGLMGMPAHRYDGIQFNILEFINEL